MEKFVQEELLQDCRSLVVTLRANFLLLIDAKEPGRDYCPFDLHCAQSVSKKLTTGRLKFVRRELGDSPATKILAGDPFRHEADRPCADVLVGRQGIAHLRRLLNLSEQQVGMID